MSTQEKTLTPDASAEDGGAGWEPSRILRIVRSETRSTT